MSLHHPLNPKGDLTVLSERRQDFFRREVREEQGVETPGILCQEGQTHHRIGLTTDLLEEEIGKDGLYQIDRLAGGKIDNDT